MSDLPDWIRTAREHWHWKGKKRPPFAVVPGPGQVSVWDFPRPPRLAQDKREIVVRWGDIEVARTRRAVLVRETAHPPSVYLPWEDVTRALFQPGARGSFCEWKGPAQYWDLHDGESCLEQVAWGYPKPLAGAEVIADYIAFYAHELECTVGGERVVAQPGSFYGGWITPDLCGPFKGDPGSSDW